MVWSEQLGRVKLQPDHVRVLAGAAHRLRGAQRGRERRPVPPVDPDQHAHAAVRVDRRDGTALAAALRAAQAARTARKDAGVVRLQLDPAELL